MEMFLRNFKWYRKMKRGKWWYVKHYDSLNYIKKLWMHDTDTVDFPESDGLIMDNIGFFYIRRGVGFSFYGWRGMQETPTEVYNEK